MVDQRAQKGLERKKHKFYYKFEMFAPKVFSYKHVKCSRKVNVTLYRYTSKYQENNLIDIKVDKKTSEF